MRKAVTIQYLEMTAPPASDAPTPDPPNTSLQRIETPCPELNRFFYTAVGGDWFWIDRLEWTVRQWQDYLERSGLETWVLYLDGAPAGYFELDAGSGSDVEVAYFGLLRQFTGRGLGRYLLSGAIARAWQTGASRVWLHTCSLDHPAALDNYLARGFRQFKEETTTVDLPDAAPGPWPGAHGTDGA